MICTTDIRIYENQDEVEVCGIKFKIIHTPGHSPAHICIVTPDNVAYLGDSLVSYELMDSAKIPYAHILSEDMKSKAKLYDLKCSKYIAAHKGIYKDIQKLIDDNIDFYEHRAFKILGFINKPMTMEQIIKYSCNKFKINIYDITKYNIIHMMIKSYIEYLYEIKLLKVIIDDRSLKYTR